MTDSIIQEQGLIFLCMSVKEYFDHCLEMVHYIYYYY